MTYIGKINSGESQSRISSINPRFIGKKDLIKIVEVEQDMWAREEGVGEYVKCDCCGKIYSKENIFGHLERKLKVQTVAEIERALGGGKPICLECGEETRAIYDRNEYIEQVIERYKDSVESFLTVYRDENGEIRGFMDGYIDNFEKIYRRELEHNYGLFGPKLLREILEKEYGKKLPDEIFMIGVLGMEEGYKNFYGIHGIMRDFFTYLNIRNGGKGFGLIEVTIGSNVHGIHNSIGINRIGIKKYFEGINFEGRECDLFYHDNFIELYLKKLSYSAKEFLRQNINNMKVA